MTPPLPERAALFLDFDGTLVEIAPRPEDVAVDPALPGTLRALIERLDGAVAVVSGRSVAQIDGFLGVPVAAAGLHGMERRAVPDGPVESPPPPPEVDVLRGRLAAHPVLAGGVFLEDKGPSLAVHYRAEPERGPEVIAAVEAAAGDLSALNVLRGKMVVEVKPAGFHKGHAVETFMAALPFAGRTPVYIGDDVTDEDGIRAANALGGFGIKVGDGDTAAPWRLPTVPAVHAWLARLAGARG
jgi:trehalose 6-phosphate phosphatase